MIQNILQLSKVLKKEVSGKKKEEATEVEESAGSWQ